MSYNTDLQENNAALLEILETVNNLPESGGNANQSGLSSTASALLVNILRNAVYTADQSANITALEVELALGGGSGSGGSGGGEASAYTVVSTLDNATIDNNASAVAAGASYIAAITPNKGYELDTVTVLMGGADVTADVYADGVITIESVTGNVIIKVTTVEASDVLYKLVAPVTFTGDSAEQINTNVKITDEDKDFTICVILNCDKQAATVFYEADENTNPIDYGFTMMLRDFYNGMIGLRFNGTGISYGNDDWRVESEGRNILICTHVAGSDEYSGYLAYPTKSGREDQSPKNGTTTIAYKKYDGNLKIGGTGFVGTLEDLAIYSRVLTADEINAYLES